jgi:hypothetical protein
MILAIGGGGTKAIPPPFRLSSETAPKSLKKTDRLTQGSFQRWLGMYRLLDSGMQPIKGV